MHARVHGLRLRLSLLFGSLSLLCTIGLAFYFDREASARITEASGETLHGIARGIASTLADHLTEREREISLFARNPLLLRSGLDSADVAKAIERRMNTYRAYAWIGVADPQGRVLSASGKLLQGADVGQRPWFIHGSQGPFLGDVHEAVLLAGKLPTPRPGEPLRFVDFASPILDENGQLRGVLGAHAHWSWVTGLVLNALPEAARQAGVEAIIVGSDGQIRYPYEYADKLKLPPGLSSDRRYALLKWDGDARYLTSSVPVRPETVTDLGWRVVVRQPVARALEGVSELRRGLLLLGGLATLLVIAITYRVATRVSRPVEALAQVARRIEGGEVTTPFPDPSSIREIHQLALSLRGMTASLVAREQELERINTSLEQTVLARTAELRHANQELEQLARSDVLTGLHNRRHANERLHGEFLRMQRSGGGYAVLLLDVDHFKKVNDTHGHDVGDQVLKQVAAILRDSARATDFVARFGGEEFLVLLPDTDAAGARVVAEKLRSAVAATPVPVAGRVTVSIGLAVAAADALREDDVVRHADEALYRAKGAGRNRVMDAIGT